MVDEPASTSAYEYKLPDATQAKPIGQKAKGPAVENLWNSILEEVVKHDEKQDSYLLMLGNQGAGKRSIVREINNKYVQGRNKSMGVEKMGSDYAALDTSFLYVKDLLDPDVASSTVTTDDNLPKLNIWTVHDAERFDLLESVLRPASLQRTAAVICLDFDDPMEIMNNLRTWLSKLSKCILSLVPEMEVGTHEKMKQSIERHVLSYEEPQVDDNGNLIIKRKEERKPGEDDSDMSADEMDVRLEIPLSEGVLKVNLGIPIVIVCNKVDIIHMSGEKSKLLQENLNFIQKHMREYSLQYGATVMFTSAKQRESKNLDTLYQYLNHRLYNFNFANKAQIVEKDELFIPSGFDSLTLIREVTTGSAGLSGGQQQSYEDFLRPMFTAMNSNRSKQFCRSGGATGTAETTFLESEDWQTLLQQKFEVQEAQAAKAEEAKDKTTPSKQKPGSAKRNFVLGANASGGALGVRESQKTPSAGTELKTPSGEAKEGQASGQAYFKKLLQSKQFKDTKKRASHRMAQEQAYKLADKVQAQMDENKSGSARNPGALADEEGSSSLSEAEDAAGNTAAQAAPEGQGDSTAAPEQA